MIAYLRIVHNFFTYLFFSDLLLDTSNVVDLSVIGSDYLEN